jgi:gluconolactonase
VSQGAFIGFVYRIAGSRSFAVWRGGPAVSNETVRISRWTTTALLVFFTLGACQQTEQQRSEVTGAGNLNPHVERFDPALDAIVPSEAAIEKVAEGFEFAEGPLWISMGGYLLLADNGLPVIHKWLPHSGVSAYINGADLDRTEPFVGGMPGAEALTLDPQGRLYVADDSHRRIAQVKDGKLVTIADRYGGRRLNSPNDLVFKSDGSMYFTDPTDGLERTDADPHRELDFAGVFRLAPVGDSANRSRPEPQLLTRALPHPNGIALSPDERFLYVSNADDVKKLWMRWELTPDGRLGRGGIFYDASRADGEGVPDGMKVDKRGNVFATGPGGLWIISPSGKPLGRIRFPQTPSNCAWGGDGKTLYVTAEHALYRVQLAVEGVIPGKK